MADTDEETQKETQKEVQKETQTLVEFQAWLSGVEEMQEDDWVPSKVQWDKIRVRIANIVADEPPAPAPMQMVPQVPMSMHMMPQAPGPGVVQQLPTPPPFVPPEYDISPAAAAMLAGNGKTPDVDASEGGVPSSFA